MRDVLLMADPVVSAVPLRECGAPLQDARDAGLAVDVRKQDPDGAWAQLRRGVLGRLEEAQSLLPDGLALLVIEGYRPLSLQTRYFEGYRQRLAELHPDWSVEELHQAASRYVSPPELAPHSAGAAVDLTLSTLDGCEVDMGTPVNASPEESQGACYMAATNISAGARHNRGILTDALSAAGLVNYPTEWWHWSFGDRYWAVVRGAAAACYGVVDQ